MMLAAAAGHNYTVKVLCTLKADLNIVDNGGHTALMHAVIKGNDETVETLHELELSESTSEGRAAESLGIHRIVQDEGLTPIFVAAMVGHTSVVKKLSALKADINARPNKMPSIVFFAALGGHDETIQALYDINLEILKQNQVAASGESPQDQGMETKLADFVNFSPDDHPCPILIAALGGHTKAVKRLQKLGANIDVKLKGISPAVAAASKKHLETVLEIQDLGGNLNAALFSLCTNARMSGREACDGISTLIQAKANFHAKDEDGKSLLDLAKHSEVRSLLQKLNIDGWTDLLISADQGDFQLVQNMINADDGNLKISQQNHWNETALYVAASKGFSKIVHFLKSKGAVVNVSTNRPTKDTALHAAARACCPDTLRVLIESKADVNDRNADGKSPLDILNDKLNQTEMQNESSETDGVSQNQHCAKRCIYLLKIMGADGWTPLMVAVQVGRYTVEKYLQMRECVLSMRVQSSVPVALQNAVVHYSSLDELVNWSWGPHDPKTIVLSEQDTKASKLNNSSEYSCIFGSESFEDGVHSWELQAFDTETLWLGIARGFEGEDFLSSSPMKTADFDNDQDDNRYRLAFGPMGEHSITGKSPVIEKFLDWEYADGQKIGFELDMFENTLKIIVDGMLTAVAYNVDDKGVRPFVCLRLRQDHKEYIKLLRQKSYVTNISSGNYSEKGMSAGFANVLQNQDVFSRLSPGNWSVNHSDICFDSLR